MSLLPILPVFPLFPFLSLSHIFRFFFFPSQFFLFFLLCLSLSPFLPFLLILPSIYSLLSFFLIFSFFFPLLFPSFSLSSFPFPFFLSSQFSVYLPIFQSLTPSTSSYLLLSLFFSFTSLLSYPFLSSFPLNPSSSSYLSSFASHIHGPSPFFTFLLYLFPLSSISFLQSPPSHISGPSSFLHFFLQSLFLFLSFPFLSFLLLSPLLPIPFSFKCYSSLLSRSSSLL